MKLNDLTRYLDDYLRIRDIKDAGGSKNGLQVEGSTEVGHVAFAVDSSLIGFQRAAELGADLLIVHHGLFWGREQVLTGPFFERIKTLIENSVGLYAAHLPLDAHETVGNNVELARILNLEVFDSLGNYEGTPLGLICRPRGGSVTRDAFVELVNEQLDTRSITQFYGPVEVTQVGVVSGGAASMIGQAAEAGLDLFLTGETKHGNVHDAEEYGVNVIFAGHYATETVGLKALARHLENEFGLRTTFIDLPTGT